MVAPRPAAVLWWARPAASDAGGNGGARLHRADLLDSDLVAPVVAEVVGVVERGPLVGDGVEASGALIVRRRSEVPVRVGDPVAATADLELVEVVVPPPERGLDDFVQLGEGDRSVDEDPPPDRRLGVEQADLELELRKCRI